MDTGSIMPISGAMTLFRDILDKINSTAHAAKDIKTNTELSRARSKNRLFAGR